MFAKLLKHEWRATAGVQAALCAAIVSLGALGMANVSALIRNGEELSDLAGVSMSLGFVFIYLALVICAAASGVLLMVRYYQSRFTDQGYLTFTLPVNVHQNFLAAFVNNLIWTVLTGICVVLAFVLVGIAVTNAIGPEALQEVKQTFAFILGDVDEEIWEIVKPLIPGYVIQALVSWLYAIILPMTCLTVGATMAKKHKILAAIGIYYLISMATSMLQNALTMTMSEEVFYDVELSLENGAAAAQDLLQQILLTTLPVQLVLLVGCYILSTQIMKKRLNLN